MAPKTIPPLAKQSLILTYLQSSRTVHTLKDLEKILPAVASINGMQVKDYLQALNDEGKIHVEKIGSGNWYWSFLSEEKKARDNVLGKLQEEKAKVDKAVQDLDSKVKEASHKREGEDGGRGEIIGVHAALAEEVKALRVELDQYKDGDPGEVVRKKDEVKSLRVMAERWTDNVGLLESWVLGMTGGDRAGLEDMRRMLYEGEYVEEGEANLIEKVVITSQQYQTQLLPRIA